MDIFSHGMGKKMEWLEEKKRQTQINSSPQSANKVYFGYERINTMDKTDRVLQHFSSVAHHYDFMNTLLSFGIHHAWKRTAVRMLKLAPGDRILDVCGGTGDLAILAARAVGPSGRVIIYDINRDMIQAGMNKVIDNEIERRLGYIQGNAEAIKIRTDASSKSDELIAAAEARAKAIRGQGDVEAAKHYKKLDANPKLAMFLRDLEALQKILESRVTFVAPMDVAPFTLLKGMPDLKQLDPNQP